MMSERNYLRACLLLPFAIGAGAFLGAAAIGPAAPADSALGALEGFLSVVWYVGLFALAPYAAFLCILWLVLRPRSDREWRRTLYLAPVIVAILFVVGAAILGEWPFDRASATKLFVYGVLSVTVGYMYVALIAFGGVIARHVGWMEASE